MRRLALAIATAGVVMVFAGALQALTPALSLARTGAGTGTGTGTGGTERESPGNDRTCNEVYDWEPGQTGTAQWGQADWEANTCSHQLQVRVHCSTRFGPVSRYSGAVKAVELNARATCPSNDALAQIAIHFSNDGGITWTSYQQLWP
jgi:hypothetical protein